MSAPVPRVRVRRPWKPLAGLALLAGAAVLWWTLRPQPLPAWQAAAWLPADAEVIAWCGPVGPAADALDGLTQRVSGLTGLADALNQSVGVDLRDPEAVARAGLRRDAGWAMSVWRSAAWWVVPVASPRGPAHIVEQLRRRGHAVQAEAGPSGKRAWRLAPRAAGGAAVEVWETDAVAVVRLPLDASPAADGAAAWQGFLAAPKHGAAALEGAPGVVHVRWPWRDGSSGRDSLHAALGPADLLLGGLVDKVQGVEADLGVDARHGLTLSVALSAAKGQLAEMAKYHVGFVRDEEALDVGDLLPDETPLLLRARLNPALWQSLPPLLRQVILPAHALQGLHPALSGIDAAQLPDRWDGQVAVGLLAVSDTLPLDPNSWPAQDWRNVLRPFVVIQCKTDVESRDLLERMRTALEGSTDVPQLWQVGAWAGWQVAGPQAPWGMLRKGRAIAFVSGASALDDVRRVADGKFPSLGKVATDAQQRQMVQGRALWHGGLVQTPRLVRALRRRGVPDYVTQLVAAVRAVAWTVTLDGDALHIDVRLHPDSGDALPPPPQAGTP